jgi:protein HIRA/HIR1
LRRAEAVQQEGRLSKHWCDASAGSDDKLVCIYELRAGSGARAFGSSDQPSVENWKHVTTLRGHMNNVLDVAWSPDDRWLASCSVDNKVLTSISNIRQT